MSCGAGDGPWFRHFVAPEQAYPRKDLYLLTSAIFNKASFRIRGQSPYLLVREFNNSFLFFQVVLQRICRYITLFTYF